MSPRIQIIAMSSDDYYVKSGLKKLKEKENQTNSAKTTRLKNYKEFQRPLHYPRYKKEEYDKMEEQRLNQLLKDYGLPFDGSIEEKRAYAIGAFLFPSKI
ncbi:hypothetical protein LUZ60_005607 [Juncus effusus]|nr:hypothetical protein LUZ60_005607 [Juncus effusus]